MYILCVVSAGTLSEPPMHNLLIINTSVYTTYVHTYICTRTQNHSYTKHIAGNILRIICRFCCFYGLNSYPFLEFFNCTWYVHTVYNDRLLDAENLIHKIF